MKKIVCLFTLVLAGSLSMAQNSKKTAAKYYNNGVEYGNSKNYSSAIRSYDKAIELNPNDAIAYINRGAAYGYRGEYDKAMSDFNKALTINPEVSLGYTNRGIIYQIEKKYDLALKDLNKAIALDDQNDLAYYYRGLTKKHLGQYKGAIDDFTTAQSLNPVKHKNALVNISQIKQEMAKKPAGAKEVAKMDANVSKSVDKANVLYASGNYREAALAYKSVLSVDPENVSALNNLGNAYFKMNEKSEACIQWEKAMNLGSENSKNNFEKACR